METSSRRITLAPRNGFLRLVPDSGSGSLMVRVSLFFFKFLRHGAPCLKDSDHSLRSFSSLELKCRPGKSRLFVPRQPSPTSNAIDTRIGIDPGAVFVVVDLLLFFLLFVPDFCSCFLFLIFS